MISAFSTAAARLGSLDSVMARTTAMRCAPAAATAPVLCGSIPPTAKNGSFELRPAKVISAWPTGGCVGPDRRRVHRTDADVVERELLRGDDLLRSVRRSAEQLLRPERRAGLRDVDPRLVDVHTVGAGRRHELRTVVEHQQGAVALARGTQRRRGAQDLLVAAVGVEQLDDVDAALQCSLQTLRLDRLADQIQPRVLKSLTWILDHAGQSVRSGSGQAAHELRSRL